MRQTSSSCNSALKPFQYCPQWRKQLIPAAMAPLSLSALLCSLKYKQITNLANSFSQLHHLPSLELCRNFRKHNFPPETPDEPVA